MNICFQCSPLGRLGTKLASRIPSEALLVIMLVAHSCFFNVLIDFGHRLSASDIYVMIYVQALTYSGFHRKSVSCASDFKYYRAAIFGGCLWQALISIYKVNFARDIGLALALRAAVVCPRRISLCPGRALWRAVVGRPCQTSYVLSCKFFGKSLTNGRRSQTMHLSAAGGRRPSHVLG